MLRSLSLALLILVGATPAFAGCEQTLFYKAPTVPSAQTSTYSQMQNAVSRVKQYISEAEENLLECSALSATRFNYYVSRLQALASAMNAQATLFQTMNKS